MQDGGRATYSTALDARNVDEHELVLIYERSQPEDYASSHGNQWREGCEHKSDGGHEEQVRAENSGVRGV